MMKISKEFVAKFISEEEIKSLEKFGIASLNEILEKKGEGNAFLGWTDLPENYNKKEFEKIKQTAQKIQNDVEILIVIGIGGSYLGAKAVIDMLGHSFYNDHATEKKETKIYFAGQNISSQYLEDLKEIIGDKEFAINVISKSGTTTEPAIAFRFFKDILVQKHGEKAGERIYATTDGNKGALYEQAKVNNWTTFVVPDDIGGRFSVLTPVGLLPIAVAGIDIDLLMQGAKNGMELYSKPTVEKNDALLYAIIRNVLYGKGKTIEMIVGYEPKLQYFNEWWKQLFGESEGKKGKGLFPSSAIFSTDLHSLGQYIQEGRRDLFETVIKINSSTKEIIIKKEEEEQDGLNYLESKTVDFVNQKATLATLQAHTEGNVPNVVIEIDKLDTAAVGELLYFFEMSCAISGYLLGINPFDQPGVESYKEKMFKLLNKPGY